MSLKLMDCVSFTISIVECVIYCDELPTRQHTCLFLVLSRTLTEKELTKINCMQSVAKICAGMHGGSDRFLAKTRGEPV